MSSQKGRQIDGCRVELPPQNCHPVPQAKKKKRETDRERLRETERKKERKLAELHNGRLADKRTCYLNIIFAA